MWSGLPFWIAIPLMLIAVGAAPADADSKPNILFIAIDDLNAWVTHLGGHPQAKTPNIDRLAQRGVTFHRAYCAAPVCNPSRTALLIGQRPSTSGVYDNATDWRNVISEMAVSLPFHFRNNGYLVFGAGKIYHGAFPRAADWTEYMSDKTGPEPKFKGSDGVGGIKFAPLDCDDKDLADWKITTWCIDKLKQKHEKPFFLACGLHRPHMPWNVPRKYYDQFPLDKIILPKVLDTDLDDIPPAGIKMARPEGDHKDIVKSGRWKDAVQGYLAAIAFADAQVGRLLDALDQSPYRDNTIIVLWGDHGWHLGEKQHWRKFALWEEATRAPFIWVAPGTTRPGGACRRPVDFMSVYPTLCDLCGLPAPKHVEGISIRPLLADPQAAWDRPALTTHMFNNHAIRTEQWRYIRYADGSEELYDHSNDPHEWVNLARNARFDQVKTDLARFLPRTNAPAKR
jgi:arylsulfatase A-like enzyme